MRAGISVTLGFLIAGCAIIPPLQEDGVAIADIVQRVKCELAYAVPDFAGTYPSGNYQWMKYWTAKIDLTLDVNDLSSIRPDSTYTTPVTHGLFTIGAGGELGNQAQRIEKLSFTLSMKELVENRHSTYCDLPYQLGLLGNLGLQEWVASALAPVENRQLTIGFHQPPAGKPITISAPSIKQGERAQELQPPPPAKAYLEKALAALRSGEQGTEEARRYAARAKQLALRTRMQDTYNAVEKTYRYVEGATTQLDNATDLAWRGAAVDRDATNKLADADSKLLKKIGEDAKAATDQLAKARETATAAWELLPRDTPINSITHTAKFVVTLRANATPNWSLVLFKGPGLSPPFASASRIRTNQLDVVMGAPAVAGGKALSDEQNRQLFNIQLHSLRKSLVVIQ